MKGRAGVLQQSSRALAQAVPPQHAPAACRPSLTTTRRWPCVQYGVLYGNRLISRSAQQFYFTAPTTPITSARRHPPTPRRPRGDARCDHVSSLPPPSPSVCGMCMSVALSGLRHSRESRPRAVAASLFSPASFSWVEDVHGRGSLGAMPSTCEQTARCGRVSSLKPFPSPSLCGTCMGYSAHVGRGRSGWPCLLSPSSSLLLLCAGRAWAWPSRGYATHERADRALWPRLLLLLWARC